MALLPIIILLFASLQSPVVSVLKDDNNTTLPEGGKWGCNISGKVCKDQYCSSKLGDGCETFNVKQHVCTDRFLSQDLKGSN